ncbi:MAG: translesion error-prone DNA polymerase V autoproteolytic subunit [Pseudomonadales bacterium]
MSRFISHLTRFNFRAPLYSARVQAGFPSPADDYLETTLDLNEHLIAHPAATFYCRVCGDSMTGVGIFDGDLLIVDRALTPRDGDVVLAVLDGELTCKILDLRGRRLLAANRRYAPVTIPEGSHFEVEGVVISSVRRHRCLPS